MRGSILALVPNIDCESAKLNRESALVHALQVFNRRNPGSRIYIAPPEDWEFGMAGRFQFLDIRLIFVTSGILRSKDGTTLAQVRSRFPNASVVCITDQYSRESVLSLLSYGIHGVIGKSHTTEQIGHAINIVLGGGIYLPDITSCSGGTEPVERSAHPIEIKGADSLEKQLQAKLGLSPKQSMVLALLTEGLTNKAIAIQLSLAEATVKVHVSAIYRVLNVRNRAGAVAAAMASSSPLSTQPDRATRMA